MQRDDEVDRGLAVVALKGNLQAIALVVFHLIPPLLDLVPAHEERDESGVEEGGEADGPEGQVAQAIVTVIHDFHLSSNAALCSEWFPDKLPERTETIFQSALRERELGAHY